MSNSESSAREIDSAHFNWFMLSVLAFWFGVLLITNPHPGLWMDGRPLGYGLQLLGALSIVLWRREVPVDV